jgi:kynureninase
VRLACDIFVTKVDLSLVDADDTVLYMVGNSLGLPARRAHAVADEILTRWQKWCVRTGAGYTCPRPFRGHHGHIHGPYPYASVDLQCVPSMARIAHTLCAYANYYYNYYILVVS